MTPTLGTSGRTTTLGAALLDAAGLDVGHRVLDVACDAGDTTLQAARRVGPRGLALGVSDSESMVQLARRRASEAGIANVGFVRADARTHRFAPLRFDVVMSRLGLTGLASLARALRPRGRLVFVSRDDAERVMAELTRAGLAQLTATRMDAARTPTRLVTAGARV
jgi:ubiquinone/menaquinone biosynthesis C-methylase UbiE